MWPALRLVLFLPFQLFAANTVLSLKPQLYQPETFLSKVPNRIHDAALASALTHNEMLLFSTEERVPFHLIVMFHFKERTRLDQHCRVSISFEFKVKV